MAETARVPVQESVGAALRNLRQHWRIGAAMAAIGALTLAIISSVTPLVPILAIPLAVLSTFVSAAVYAAFTRLSLSGADSVRLAVLSDAWRVWSAMIVVGFFLFIVFVVLALPGLVVMGVILAPRYGEALQSATGDEAASIAVMQRIATENPGLILAYIIFYGLIWLLVTSRLYLSAPATLDAKRVLTFETWPWTKGGMWRITGARLLLLAPAYVLYSALTYLFGLPFGANAADPIALESFGRANGPAFAALSFIGGFLQLGLYVALEAGLSAHLYRGMKPAGPTVG